MGHDIAPGASYCPHGHPIALDAMKFDAYGGAPAPQQGGYQAAPPQQAPQGQYGAPPPPQQPQQGYGGQQAYGAPPPPQQGGFGQPQQQQGGYGAPAGFPQQPPAPAPFGAPQQPPQPAFGGFGQQPPQPAPFGAPAPAQQPAPAQAPAAAPQGELGPKAVRGFCVSYQANPNGDFWPLTGGRLVVGRAGSGDTVDITIADPTISSRHAAFVVDGPGGTVSVEDTGSTNGTFVNDEHLGFNGKRELRDGDRVRFGGFTTIVKVIGRV
jgi:hypothetical protein